MSSRLEVVYKDLQKEHHRVVQLIERLRAHDSETDLVPLLEKLRTLLIVHFAREQLPDGFYDALGERAAQRGDEIKALTGDHATILSTLNTLIEDADPPHQTDEANVLERTRQLVDKIRDHEEREHRFATQVLGIEPGA